MSGSLVKNPGPVFWLLGSRLFQKKQHADLEPCSADFQPADRGQDGRAWVFLRPADWKLATQQVGNLRYEVEVHARKNN